MSIVEPGAFHTDAPTKMGEGFSHPAYTDPALPSKQARGFFHNTGRFGRDAAKAVQRIYDLSLVADPPLRFALGPDSVGAVKKQLKDVEQDVVKYESWSEGLDFDD